ncbi:hypothetical protein BJX65DRAFT_102728 [Aspergillus insuetus]
MANIGDRWCHRLVLTLFAQRCASSIHSTHQQPVTATVLWPSVQTLYHRSCRTPSRLLGFLASHHLLHAVRILANPGARFWLGWPNSNLEHPYHPSVASSVIFVHRSLDTSAPPLRLCLFVFLKVQLGYKTSTPFSETS